MKKLLTAVLTVCLIFCIAACGSTEIANSVAETTNQERTELNETENDEILNTEQEESLSQWESAGKGVGKLLPEPEAEYDLPQYSSFISAEIENSDYDFFEDYVEKCIAAGFAGSIATAESPDYYYNGKTDNGERVQVMYYEEEMRCTISAFPAE